MFKRILVATDFAAASSRALDVAVRLAAENGARLTLLHVCEVPAYAYASMGLSPVDLLAPIVEVAEGHLDELVAATRKRGATVDGVFKVGSPYEQILEVAAEVNSDLVVLGTHGRRGIARAAIGSVAEKVVRLCPVPVLIVHAPAP